MHLIEDLDLSRHDTYLSELRRLLEARSGQAVERIDTHISSLLLTRDLAYKFKRPVRLPFVDFSSPALREHFCREELRLNRRLAPQLYLCVVPITGEPSAPRLGGMGKPIDHAVCMRRFPAKGLWSERLSDGLLGRGDVEQFAQRLARFHASAPIAPTTSKFGTPALVHHRVSGVLEQLNALDCHVGMVGAWMERQCEALRSAFERRRASGAVREVHGDLHLENIVVLADGEVTAFDCVEFDPSLRWIDVMADLGFATMDLKARGRPDLAWKLLDDYLAPSGDHAGLAVLRFYEVERALVRALVARMRPRAAQGPETAVDYLTVATALARSSEEPPRLAITCGVTGSGKSRLAGALVERWGAVRLRSDVERKRLFGLAPLQRSREARVNLYAPESTGRTYERLHHLAREALRAGYPTIVDATFLQRAQRESFRSLAEALRVPFVVLHCTADLSTLRARAAERAGLRDDPSEATPAVLEFQLSQQEVPGEAEHAWTRHVDMAHPLDIGALVGRSGLTTP